jgi:hypothetical protein
LRNKEGGMGFRRAWLVLMVLLVGVGLAVTAQGNPSIWTDKADYAPEETVHVSGSGFDHDTSLTIKVTRPDGSVVTGDGSFVAWPTAYDSVVVNTEGGFRYNYVLDGIEGKYLVEAIDGEGKTLASCTFTDKRLKTRITLTLSPSSVCGGTSVTASAKLEFRYWWHGWHWKEMKYRRILFYLDGSYEGKAGTGHTGTATYGFSTTGLVPGAHTVKAKYAGGFITKPSHDTATLAIYQAPSITCPSDIAQGNDQGQCNAVVNWSVTATGNPTPTVSCSPASGSTFSVGTTTVTCTATNLCGTDTCSFNVTVNDVESPTTAFTSTPPNPDNNPDPYFGWTGVDNCTASGDLVYSNRLDVGAWSAWSAPTSITLTGLSEGTHTFEVRAMDEAGNIETTASYTWLLDLTPPVITIITPEDQADYGLNDVVLADWRVSDALSGLSSVVGTVPSGEAIDTTTQGFHKFTVTATDLAGNTNTVTVTYRVVYVVHPGGVAGGGGGAEGEGGTFLDKSIAGGGGAVGITTLEAVYTIGDVIHVIFSLTDAKDNNVAGAVVSCTLVKVTLGEEEAYDILNLWGFNYDADTELYSLDIATEGLAPGTYDLWLGFDDGTQTRLRIELLQGES